MGRCFGLSKPANDTFSFFFETSGTSCNHIFGPPATTGKFMFFVGTYNGTMAEFWIGYDNGTLSKVAQKSYSGSIRTGNNQFLGDNDVNGNSIDGRVDEVKVYNRSMSYDEIHAHFNRRKFVNPEPSATFGAAEDAPSPNANETVGDNAIVTGIVNALGNSVPIYSDQLIYVRNQTNNQTSGKFDKVASNSTKRWAINYVTAGENYANIYNLTPSFYTLELSNLPSANITLEVELFISRTK